MEASREITTALLSSAEPQRRPLRLIAESVVSGKPELIKSLAGRVSVLMIEHDVDLVMNLSDHVIVLHQGQKLFEGPPVEVRNSSAVRAAYLGEGA